VGAALLEEADEVQVDELLELEATELTTDDELLVWMGDTAADEVVVGWLP